MNKMIAALAAGFIAVLMLAMPASATGGDHPGADNKPVTFCHYAGSNENGGSGNYVKITTNVMAFYNAGHIDHVNDIWEAFSYVNNAGDTVNVPAQGDTSLLAFDNCAEPQVNERVTRPEPVFADPCGTENDVFSVAPGRGFTVGSTQTDGVIQVINVTLADGFDWTDGDRAPIRIERPAFTNVDCGLPNTGGGDTATQAGIIAAGGAALLGVMTLVGGRRRRSLI